jgi:signal transduction histidine kinase
MDRIRRQDLAKSLHDGPLQELTVARIRVDVLRALPLDLEAAREVDALGAALDTTAGQLRALMTALSDTG